jgi:hypothetical protein
MNRTRRRIHLALDALWPLALLWCGLLIFAFAFDADWHTLRYGERADETCVAEHAESTVTVALAECTRTIDQLLDVSLIAGLGSLCVVIATMNVRRMYGLDWLTLALSSVFVALAIWFFLAVGVRMWAEWYADNRDWLLNTVRATIGVTMIWAFLLLISTPNEGSYE